MNSDITSLMISDRAAKCNSTSVSLAKEGGNDVIEDFPSPRVQDVYTLMVR
jgi:hypothetical protein